MDAGFQERVGGARIASRTHSHTHSHTHTHTQTHTREEGSDGEGEARVGEVGNNVHVCARTPHTHTRTRREEIQTPPSGSLYPVYQMRSRVFTR